MRLKQIYSGLYFLKFPNQYELTMTMIRLQEFYESPYLKIRGKVFTLEEFMDIYAKNTGNFTYCTDWNGFNIPGEIIIDFYLTYWDDLREKEKQLWSQIDDIVLNNYSYFIAGCDNTVLAHETAHGLFYLNENYRKQILELIKTMPAGFIYRFQQALKKRGYCKKVYADEIQAYCIDNIISGCNQLDTLKVLPGEKILWKQFYKIFKKYYREKLK